MATSWLWSLPFRFPKRMAPHHLRGGATSLRGEVMTSPPSVPVSSTAPGHHRTQMATLTPMIQR